MKEQKIKFTPIPSTAEVKAERDRLAYRRRYLRVLRSTVYALLVVAAVAVLLATLFLPVLQVSGDSMNPTLQDKDIILLVKTDNSKKLLTGAKFKLYDTKDSNTPVNLIKDTATGNYRVAETGETGAIEEIEINRYNAVTISGLNKKTYYLEETQAPEGYNKLTERQPVELGKEGFVTNATLTGSGAKGAEWTEGGVQVINNAGATLPSTGGMGTTLFYVIGGGLMVAAVVLLVTKKRMENK